VRPAGLVMLWLVLMLICVGLGYPTLRRYDPRDPRVHFDTANKLYHWQVTRSPAEGPYLPDLVHYRYRVLVPSIARPFYLLANGRVGTWDAGYFGLLMANSIFCATTALLLFLLARDTLKDHATALAAALLYLLTFAVPNFHLAGLIDSGEAFALLALVWCLHRERWYLLPLLAVPGELAKETFLPFSVAVATGWILAAWRTTPPAERGRRLMACALLAVSGVATLIATFSIANGTLVLPWQLTKSGMPGNLDMSLVQRAVNLGRDIGLVYFFGWLAPLAALSLRACPRPWVAGAGAAAATALALGIVNGEPGISRSLFNILGPLLTLAAALTLTRMLPTSSSLP